MDDVGEVPLVRQLLGDSRRQLFRHLQILERAWFGRGSRSMHQGEKLFHRMSQLLRRFLGEFPAAVQSSHCLPELRPLLQMVRHLFCDSRIRDPGLGWPRTARRAMIPA